MLLPGYFIGPNSDSPITCQIYKIINETEALKEISYDWAGCDISLGRQEILLIAGQDISSNDTFEIVLTGFYSTPPDSVNISGIH